MLNHCLAGIPGLSGLRRAYPETDYYFGFLPRLSELFKSGSPNYSAGDSPSLSELPRPSGILSWATLATITTTKYTGILSN